MFFCFMGILYCNGAMLRCCTLCRLFFFFKQKTAYEMRISDWSSDVCSSDLGTFLDDTAMLVIVAPLYVPLVELLGFDLIWYGILYTITCQIAYMTPPFGYNLFLIRALAPKEVTIFDIYRSNIPFVLVLLIGLTLVMDYQPTNSEDGHVGKEGVT